MHEEPSSTRRNFDLCSPFLDVLPVAGASVSVFDPAGRQISLVASDGIAARIDELQFDLGEGPLWDCIRTGRPVLTPEIDLEAEHSWPVFVSELEALAVAGLFTLPLTMGAVTVGAVTLHRPAPGRLSGAELSDALATANAIAGIAVRRAIRAAGDGDDPTAPVGIRREVHQATGMVLVQLSTTATDAFARLQAHAFATGSTVHQVSLDVLSREFSFADQAD